MKIKPLTVAILMASPVAWCAEPTPPQSLIYSSGNSATGNSINSVLTGDPHGVPTQSQIDAYDALTLEENTSDTYVPHFIIGPEGLDYADINLYGLNGFYLGAGYHSDDSAHAVTGLDGAITSVYNFGDYLYYLASGSYLAAWENNIPLLSGEGRILWVGTGATIGDVTNNAGMTLSSQTTTLTFSGDTGTVTNAGTVTAGDTAVEITDTGTVSALNNSGGMTAPVAISNAGTITGALTNTGTINGDIVNTGTIGGGILNSGQINGDITLGDAALTLEGNEADVSGTITGSSASAISIGTASDSTAYTADSSATAGTISVTEGSTLTLADNTQWTATAGSADAFSNSGTLVLDTGSALNGSLTNTGTLALGDESTTSATVNGSVVNSGSIVLNPTATSAGNTLTIDGDYTGNTGSSVSLGAVLAGDDSLTDRLVITGNTSGSSTLYVTNENGSGAQTLEGIQLIEVDGTSGADFTLGNRVVAGAYDYSLQKGNSSGTDTSGWYLTSYLTDGDDTGTDSGTDTVRAVRPEAGSYTANLQAAGTMFAMSLLDRAGETQYIDPLTGNTETSSLWLRQVGGRNKASLSDGQNKTAANRYVVQLGGDVWQGQGEGGKLRLGVMGGYADQNSNTRNSLTGYRSEGSVDGYSAGLYATWYQNPEAKGGLYVDSWLQYAWFDNEVKGQDLSPETYNSKGMMASAETGYDLQVAGWTTESGLQNTLWLQPHGQVIWSGISADDHTESNGTQVQSSGQDNVQLKLGMRTYLNGKSAVDKDTGREFQPFVEANWIYNTKQYGASLGGTEDNVTGSRNAGELKAGLEGKVSQAMTVWTSVAQVMGGKGYSDTEGMLGLRYQF